MSIPHEESMYSYATYFAGVDEQPLICRKSATAGTVQVPYARLPAAGKIHSCSNIHTD